MEKNKVRKVLLACTVLVLILISPLIINVVVVSLKPNRPGEIPSKTWPAQELVRDVTLMSDMAKRWRETHVGVTIDSWEFLTGSEEFDESMFSFKRLFKKEVLVYTKKNEVVQKITGQKIEIGNEDDGKGLKYISFKELDKHSCQRLANELTFAQGYAASGHWKPKFSINGQKFLVDRPLEITGALRERQDELCKASGGNVIVVYGI